jgi:hypothetical protein
VVVLVGGEEHRVVTPSCVHCDETMSFCYYYPRCGDPVTLCKGSKSGLCLNFKQGMFTIKCEETLLEEKRNAKNYWAKVEVNVKRKQQQSLKADSVRTELARNEWTHCHENNTWHNDFSAIQELNIFQRRGIAEKLQHPCKTVILGGLLDLMDMELFGLAYLSHVLGMGYNTETIYFSNMDLYQRLTTVHNTFIENMKLPEILQGGKWCMMKEVDICSACHLSVPSFYDECRPKVF